MDRPTLALTQTIETDGGGYKTLYAGDQPTPVDGRKVTYRKAWVGGQVPDWDAIEAANKPKPTKKKATAKKAKKGKD